MSAIADRYADLLRRFGHEPWFARAGRALTPVDRALKRLRESDTADVLRDGMAA